MCASGEMAQENMKNRSLKVLSIEIRDSLGVHHPKILELKPHICGPNRREGLEQ